MPLADLVFLAPLSSIVVDLGHTVSHKVGDQVNSDNARDPHQESAVTNHVVQKRRDEIGASNPSGNDEGTAQRMLLDLLANLSQYPVPL